MTVKNRAFYIVLDLVSMIISFLLSVLLREPVVQNKDWQELWFGCILLVLLYLLVILFYQPQRPLMKRNSWNEFRIVATVNFQMALVLAMLLYLFKVTNHFPRSFYLIFFVFNVAGMYLGRTALKHLVITYYRNPANKKKLLICANESNVLKVLHKFVKSSLYEYEPVAVMVVRDEEDRGRGAGEMDPAGGGGKGGGEGKPRIELIHFRHGPQGMYLENSKENLDIFLKHQVLDEALLSLPDSPKKALAGFVNKLENMGIQTHVTINTFCFGKKEKKVQDFGVYHVLTYSPRIFEPTELLLKRLLDLTGGMVGAALTVLVGIILVPAIYLESPGPVIFKQTRVGRNGRRFSIYKFRSMYRDAEARKKELMEKNEMSGLMFKIKDDPRITKVGKFIRRTSIDEFPQFFNVLKGDMSLVGTRPPTEEEFLQYEEHHKRRLSLKPGITGMWQVRGRNGITDFEDVVKLDLEYIDNWSVWLDVKLLCETLWVVLSGRGAE